MKHLLVRTKFDYSWARGPVLIVRTIACTILCFKMHSIVHLLCITLFVQKNIDQFGRVLF